MTTRSLREKRYSRRVPSPDTAALGPDTQNKSHRLGGNDPRNVVNRLTAGGANGVQIEQPFAARRDHGPAIVKAVVDVYRAL